MFKKIATLVLLLPVISALQLNTPTQTLTSGGQFTITWTTTSGDPATFDLELVNTSFHSTFAIKASVETSDGTLTLTIPAVDPGDGYSIEATAIGNINDVLSEIGPFTIGAAVSTTSSSTTVSSSSSSTLSGGPLSSSGSFGSTVSGSSQPSGSSGTTTSTSGTSTGSSSAFNGASVVTPGGFASTVVLVVAAGAALFGF